MIKFQTTDWENIPGIEHKGESGSALWKTLQYDNIRVRLLEYSPGYKADHWCDAGHIIFCVEGSFISHLKDGSQHLLTQGMSYQASDDEKNTHRSSTETGCKLFIVDGEFLKL